MFRGLVGSGVQMYSSTHTHAHVHTHTHRERDRELVEISSRRV